MSRLVLSALAIGLAIRLTGGMPMAEAGTFDVKCVEVTKGEHEVAFGAA